MLITRRQNRVILGETLPGLLEAAKRECYESNAYMSNLDVTYHKYFKINTIICCFDVGAVGLPCWVITSNNIISKTLS